MRDIETQIRDLINNTRTRNQLMRDIGKWHQLCSCLDVIGDTTLAIDAYVDGGICAADSDHAVGTTYLLVYGLLQVLIVQQDAVMHLHHALGMRFDRKEHPTLLAIRDIRNASVGHPTRKEQPKRDPVSYHFISRPTLSRGGFQLLSSDEHGSNVFSTVDIPALILDQREVVAELLKGVVEELKRRDAEHKAEFRMEKLADLFPHTLLYSFQKLDEAIWGTSPRGLGELALDEVEGSMSRFREALDRRGYKTDGTGSLGYAYEELAYPLEQLRRYLKFEESDIATDQIAEMVAFFIQARVDELIELARHIDEEYTVDECAM